MGSLRLILVSIAAVLLVGCGSGPATDVAGTPKNIDKKTEAPKKEGGQGAQAAAGTATLGPGAADAENRVGSKAGGK